MSENLNLFGPLQDTACGFLSDLAKAPRSDIVSGGKRYISDMPNLLQPALSIFIA
jgi:hypothetical protein